MKKKLYEKSWVRIVVTVIFLIVVQVLFSIPAPCKWLDAVWEAGDLILFVGTLVLGYVAISQSQYANKIATQANETSEKLIDLQELEYMPAIIVQAFAGTTKHNASPLTNDFSSKIALHEMRTKDDDVLLGYSIALADKPLNVTNRTFCRDYEIHFQYLVQVFN